MTFAVFHNVVCKMAEGWLGREHRFEAGRHEFGNRGALEQATGAVLEEERYGNRPIFLKQEGGTTCFYGGTGGHCYSAFC